MAQKEVHSNDKFIAIRFSSFDPGVFVDLETFFAQLFRLLWIASLGVGIGETHIQLSFNFAGSSLYEALQAARDADP